MNFDLSIRGVDALLFRDGRPFDSTPGSRAETLRVPFPSTVTGLLRAVLGQSIGSFESVGDLLKMRGPLLCRNSAPIFAAPGDAVVYRDDQGKPKIMRLRPWSKDQLGDAGCGIPGGMRPLKVTGDVKPDDRYRYWTHADMNRWLMDEWAPNDAPCEMIQGPETDTRIHLKVESEQGVAEEGMLFTTEMVAFERHENSWRKPEETLTEEWSLLCRLELTGDMASLTGPRVFGGEQGVAVVSKEGHWPDCSPELKAKLESTSRIRMILATPAIFEYGWIPGWLDKSTKTGAPPGLNVQLKLVSAAVPRRQPVSGWVYSGRQEGSSSRGYPKPVRWTAPAGSVYFFEKVGGDSSVLGNDGWLAPVSDDEPNKNGEPFTRNRDDGFGVALWGVWDEKEESR